MPVYEILNMDGNEHHVAIRSKGLPKELILPQGALWAMLVRDGVHKFALNSGLVGVRMIVENAPEGAPPGMMFVARFMLPAVCEQRVTLDPLLSPIEEVE